MFTLQGIKFFSEWNEGELSSFLIEITAKIFAKTDDETGEPLVEMILDKAGQKGTGRWTSQTALEIGAPIPTITAAVDGRIISSFKAELMPPQGKSASTQSQGDYLRPRIAFPGDLMSCRRSLLLWN